MPDTNSLVAYAARRDGWLARVVESLRADDRFVGAWLAGSFGRGTQDEMSDLDLHVVLADDADPLLRKPIQVWANTTPERREVFERFGSLVITHENHWNAICDGTFTLLAYADQVMVDWQFIPASKALRPPFTQLLFAKIAIPYAPMPVAEDLETRRAALAEQTGYFWLMTSTACRYVLRRDTPAIIAQLHMIHGVLDEIERLLRGAPDVWGQHFLPRFDVTALDLQTWIDRLRGYCRHMLDLYPRIEAVVDGPIHPAPMHHIDTLLTMAVPASRTSIQH